MKKKKKGINGRKKGHDFERKIAKVLTEWTGIKIARSPQSGGWNKTGDITPKEPEDMVNFPFNFELKKRQSWLYSDLLTGYKKNNGILAWWHQCLSDSLVSKRIPILLFTKNRDEIYCCISLETFKKLELKIKTLRFKNLRFFLFKNLLENKYEDILKRLKR